MNQRLVRTIDDIIHKEKKKQTLVIELYPTYNKLKDLYEDKANTLYQKVHDVEVFLGKSKRMKGYQYEVEGLNLTTALSAIEKTLSKIQRQIADEGQRTKDYHSMLSFTDSVNDFKQSLAKKLYFFDPKKEQDPNNPSSQTVVTQVAMSMTEMLYNIDKIIGFARFYEYFKGLIRYEQLVEKSYYLMKAYGKQALAKNLNREKFILLDNRREEIAQGCIQNSTAILAVKGELMNRFKEVHQQLTLLEQQVASLH